MLFLDSLTIILNGKNNTTVKYLLLENNHCMCVWLSVFHTIANDILQKNGNSGLVIIQ